MRSSARARSRCRISRVASCPTRVLVVNSVIRHPIEVGQAQLGAGVGPFPAGQPRPVSQGSIPVSSATCAPFYGRPFGS